MQPHQHSHSLFRTASGLLCRRPSEGPERYNLLIRNLRTWETTLNGQPIEYLLYRQIVDRITDQFPGCCLIATTRQIVFSYPKKQPPHTWQ